jgi:heme/copper-type cytochrome/quinol oxidase subunit 3
LAALGRAGAFATFVVFAWRDYSEEQISTSELAEIDRRRRETRQALVERGAPGFAVVEAPDTQIRDPHKLGARAQAFKGPASKRIVAGYGFWIFLLSDFVMFSGFYAAFAVLSHATSDGPAAQDLFDLKKVAFKTGLLLASSFICGMVTLALNARNMLWTQVSYLFTGLLGLGILLLEGSEFAKMLTEGAGSQRSAFLSAFFALVGLHGLHVTIGLLWLGTMMAQVWTKGFRPDISRRGMCFALFWHALDIIWVGIFTNVYLLETSP